MGCKMRLFQRSVSEPLLCQSTNNVHCQSAHPSSHELTNFADALETSRARASVHFEALQSTLGTGAAVAAQDKSHGREVSALWKRCAYLAQFLRANLAMLSRKRHNASRDPRGGEAISKAVAMFYDELARELGHYNTSARQLTDLLASCATSTVPDHRHRELCYNTFVTAYEALLLHMDAHRDMCGPPSTVDRRTVAARVFALASRCVRGHAPVGCCPANPVIARGWVRGAA
jgi:hypothetical protein